MFCKPTLKSIFSTFAVEEVEVFATCLKVGLEPLRKGLEVGLQVRLWRQMAGHEQGFQLGVVVKESRDKIHLFFLSRARTFFFFF